MKEIGIVILPPEHIQKKANEIKQQILDLLKKNGLEMEDEPAINIPHISLFQMNIEITKLDELYKIIEDQISWLRIQITIEMDSFLTDTGRRIFWSSSQAKNNDLVCSLHKKTVDNIVDLRHSKPIRQIINSYENLNQEQKELVASYGTFGSIPEISFDPHITLMYKSGKNRLNSKGDFVKIFKLMEQVQIDSMKFEVKELAIVEIGLEGNIEKILETIPFISSDISSRIVI